MNFFALDEEAGDFNKLLDLCLKAREKPEPKDVEAVRIRTDPDNTATKVIEYLVIEGTIQLWIPINLRKA